MVVAVSKVGEGEAKSLPLEAFVVGDFVVARALGFGQFGDRVVRLIEVDHRIAID